MIGFIKAWRAVLSPMYGDVCKFYPTCSEYGLEAVRLHGAIKGGALTLSRVARCHPWSMGGYEPVPGSPRWLDLQQELRAASDDDSHPHDHSDVDRGGPRVRLAPQGGKTL